MKKILTWILLSVFALSIFTSAASAATNYRYEYDANNRLIRVYQVGTNIVYELKYDKNGNLLKTEKIDKSDNLITNLSATPDYNKVTLKWTASTGVTGYKVYKNGVYLSTIGNVTTYSITGLVAGAYTFALVPITASGDGTMVSTNSIQVFNPPVWTGDPNPPGGGGGRVTPGDPDAAL